MIFKFDLKKLKKEKNVNINDEKYHFFLEAYFWTIWFFTLMYKLRMR